MENMALQVVTDVVKYYEKNISSLQKEQANEILNQIKPIADLVIVQYDSLKSRLNNYQMMQMQAHKNREMAKERGETNLSQYSVKASKELENDFKNFYKTVLVFQAALQKIQGIKMKVSFASNSGVIYEFDELSFMKEIEQITRVGYTSDFKMQLSFSGVSKKGVKKNIEGENNTHTQEVYKEILKRAARSKQVIRKKSEILILWQIGPGKKPGAHKWDGVFTMNIGDIKEIYLKFIYNNKKWRSKKMEPSVKEYMLQVLKVDNVSGALVGDFKDSENFEIAAKSLNGTLFGYQQMVNIAKDISAGTFSGLGQFLRGTKGKGTRNYRLSDKNTKIIAKDLSSALTEVTKKELDFPKKI